MSLVIVASHWKEDINWLKKSKFPVILIDKIDSDPSWMKPSYIIEKNTGKEVPSYLKYIIENYENLPERMAFIHSHETAPHQCFSRHILEVIENANEKYDFVSLNNVARVYYFFNETDKRYTQIEDIWDTYEFPYPRPEKCSQILATPHGQFVVSKKAVLRNPKSLYQKWYDIIINTDGGRYPRGTPEEDYTTYVSETFFELFWHLIFGESLICKIMPDWFLFPPEPVRLWIPDCYNSSPQYLYFN